ncbi:MAG: hypothetical protein SAJ12_02125 [Jaaginema sp. PMC 1079.18]|nr:hypothetical protein [Jaaginema sp. PMC 1080.18]MEC4849785.1 hypothetical protein [Jaaginema sp. PMC 1079.18]MEC4865710.1 hypothetical protein [Jaaginema sp. PMC 1078.18]
MIVALAGRRIDAPHQNPPRFPLANIAKVKAEIRQQLQECHATMLVCSGACGADLLALEVAMELGIPCRLILPFEPERFREISVVDRPGEWGLIFDRILQQVTAENNVVILQEESDQEAFIAVNHVILDEAIALSQQEYPHQNPSALIVWNGCSRGKSDVTHEFMMKAEELGFKVVEILTCTPIPY